MVMAERAPSIDAIHWLDLVSEVDGMPPKIAGPIAARVPSALLSREAGRLAHRGLTHLVVELHGPTSACHQQVTRSLFPMAASPEPFDATLAAIGHARAHGIAVVMLTEVSRSSARVLRELSALSARLQVTGLFFHAPWAPPELSPPQLPRAALTIPFVLDAALRAQKAGVEVGLFGMPLCLLGPHRGLALAPFAPPEAAPCDGCAARTRCGGLGPAYRQLFGASELRPIDDTRAEDPSSLARLARRVMEPQ